jgi:hypothetical protein
MRDLYTVMRDLCVVMRAEYGLLWSVTSLLSSTVHWYGLSVQFCTMPLHTRQPGYSVIFFYSHRFRFSKKRYEKCKFIDIDMRLDKYNA